MLKNTPINEYVPSICIENSTDLSKIKNNQTLAVGWKSGSNPEHRLSSEFFLNNNCETFIDVGCWTGVNAYFFCKEVKPKKTILIDAVPTYLKFAKDLFSKDASLNNIYFNELLILVRKDIESWPGYFVVDINNTLDTSNKQDHASAT
jgi:SAM-dependent methyltransferase